MANAWMCDVLSCRLKIAKGIIVSKLFIKVNSSDSSYMPERVAVFGCSSTVGKQHTLKETTIPLYGLLSLFTIIANCSVCSEQSSMF